MTDGSWAATGKSGRESQGRNGGGADLEGHAATVEDSSFDSG